MIIIYIKVKVNSFEKIFGKNMKKVLNVAVAVIHFGEKYLLGYRNAKQHQGDKYEFIGGKIETLKNGISETPKQGLIREVLEEIGCDISQNLAIKMGVIRHDYSDKSVALHCFKIELNQSQFDHLQGETGTEGQAITWVKKTDLLAQQYPLPTANARILDWLTLPNMIFISQALQYFDNEQDWVNFYTEKLPKNAVFYCRLQADLTQSFSAVSKFLAQRNDNLPMIQFKLWQNFSQQDFQQFDPQNFIIHLNHAELMTLNFDELPKNHRYFASSHDKNSLSKLNQLAESHTVMGCFLSPVLATPTHPESKGIGWETFSELAEMCDVPVFALGGMGFEQLPQVWQNHGFGVAGIRLLNHNVTQS